MNAHDRTNVNRVLQHLSREWMQPVWKVIHLIQQSIDRSWEEAMLDADKKALWDRYFPNGKPTPEEYILLLGHAHEENVDIPYLLKE